MLEKLLPWWLLHLLLLLRLFTSALLFINGGLTCSLGYLDNFYLTCHNLATFPIFNLICFHKLAVRISMCSTTSIYDISFSRFYILLKQDTWGSATTYLLVETKFSFYIFSQLHVNDAFIILLRHSWACWLVYCFCLFIKFPLQDFNCQI